MMKSTALFALVLLTTCYPATAKQPHGHRHVARTIHHANHASERQAHSGITCDMVRAYVAQVGLAQAVAMAQSAGITSSEKERARRCLAQKG
jgi:hypothetical protein